MARRPFDSPTLRYKRQRALGATPDLALAVVVSSYGFSHNLVQLRPDGSTKDIDPKWTLRQLEAIYFLRTLVQDGLIGGPSH